MLETLSIFGTLETGTMLLSRTVEQMTISDSGSCWFATTISSDAAWAQGPMIKRFMEQHAAVAVAPQLVIGVSLLHAPRWTSDPGGGSGFIYNGKKTTLARR
jgi:hypothetical protein